MSGKRKLNSLSFKEKRDLIELFEKSNVSKTAFAKEHNIPRTTLNDILASKKILEEADCKDKRKRMRRSKFDEIEEVLVRWLKHARSQNVPISAVILKEKAIEIAKELNIEDFGGSNGWLERFKERHCLSFKSICGEAAAVDSDAIENWKNSVLKQILSQFDASNVFNLDKIGLFYRLLPDKTLSFKGEKCTSGKASKQRLTVLLGASMSGEKLKPLVIGKSKKPRCFKNVKSLPVEYDANSNAWMTTTIWERHIRKLDSQFLRQKRNVVIIIDNCTAHNRPENLKAIEIVFLPSNVTARLQPLDQGVIHDFKRQYKKMLVKDLIKALDRKEKLQVSVLDAINYIDKSWSSVSSQTVSNCFRHAGFIENAESEETLSDEDMVDPEPLESLLQIADEKGCTVNDITAFVSIDDDVAICSQGNVKALTSEFLKEKHEDSSSEDSDTENMEGHQTPPSKTETIEALKKVRKYIPGNNSSNRRRN